jgi:hypothetical protein
VALQLLALRNEVDAGCKQVVEKEEEGVHACLLWFECRCCDDDNSDGDVDVVVRDDEDTFEEEGAGEDGNSDLEHGFTRVCKRVSAFAVVSV